MGNSIFLNRGGAFITMAWEVSGIEGGHQPRSVERFEALYRGGLQWIDATNPKRFIGESACGDEQDTRVGLLILRYGQFDMQIQWLGLYFFVVFAAHFIR